MILSDGTSYERKAIEEWLRAGNRRSPKTNQVLSSLNVYPNNALKVVIQEFAEKQYKRYVDVLIAAGNCKKRKIMTDDGNNKEGEV